MPEAAFIPNTPISSAAINSDFSDIASALTASLARDGQGGMLAVLPMANSGFIYLADPNTGMSRSAADTQVITCGGANIVTVDTSGVGINGSETITGNLVVGGNINGTGGTLVPPGLIFPYAGGVAPPGYLICDGNAYSRTTYAALFAIIGTVYGAGNGTTTFNLPDLRGRVPAMLDGGTARLPAIAALGDHAGSATNTILQTNLPAATLATTIIDLGHAHGVTGGVNGATGTSSAVAAAGVQLLTGSSAITISSATTGITASTQLGGSGTALNNVQPSFGIIYLIKT